jgi:hypothetical protein
MINNKRIFILGATVALACFAIFSICVTSVPMASAQNMTGGNKTSMGNMTGSNATGTISTYY